MRVISGIYRSRKLIGYDMVGIRPTKDSVKESIFAMINPYIKDSICLDLFCGTGSLGIEAISNGAKSSYFVDFSKNSIDITKENIDSLKIKESVVINDNYTDALHKFKNNSNTFDIIFLDPPYGKIRIEEVINQIMDSKILNNNGIIVCEYEEEDLKDNYNSLELLKFKKYGKTYIRIYINRM